MAQLKLNTKLDEIAVTKSKNPQYLACGLLCIGGFLGGTITGWSSPGLPSIQASGKFSLLPSDLSWIASIVQLGLVLSAPTAGYMIRKFGRKNTLLFSSIPFLIGSTVLAFPVQVWMFFVGRFLDGFGLGLSIIAGSIYLSEISEPNLRGSLGVVWFVSIRLGVLFSYGVGSLISHDKLSGISAILSVVFGLSVLFLPESPRWLMAKWKTQLATNSLCWLRACDKGKPSAEILLEIDAIQDAVIRAEINSKTLTIATIIGDRSIFKPVLIANALMFFKEACGGMVFSSFAVQIFDQTGSALSSHLSGIAVGVAQLISLFVTTYYVDKVGRRILLKLTYITLTISLVLIGLFYEFRTDIESKLTANQAGWIPLVIFLIYHAAYSGGPFVLTWTVCSEIIPSNVIGSVSGLASAFGWLSSFAFTRYYQDMNDSIGIANTFFLYAIFSLMGAACIHLIVPETVGQTLENIHQHRNQEDCKNKENIRMKKDARCCYFTIERNTK
ncbi:unnamed protein product [Orchesella dallaii]|uniref:Major facilitator superfamily (MFS) profile domain-containing protein n=1 Tax=Orchesella dallaii TaxID=48710 RepID=A0ABP1S725_9HEXA